MFFPRFLGCANLHTLFSSGFMPLDESDKLVAARAVLADWRVLSVCRPDEERIKRMADIVWPAIERLDAQAPITREYGDVAIARDLSIATLKKHPDYNDIVSFIPYWLLPLILKIIVSILIDFWLTHERGM